MSNLIPIYHDDIEAAANDRKRIAAMRDGIRQKFSEFFNAKGFARKEPGKMIPEDDESVLFTGSTISTFKPYLRAGNVPQNGLYMIQSCLRTQNTGILKNRNKQPQWASYFSSIGALTQPSSLDELSAQTWEFYTNYLGIPSDQLKVRIASKDVDLLKHWQNAGLEDHLEFDQNDPVYYTHKFGMDGVSGRNCNLAVIDHKSGELRDIGNIIVIETEEATLGAEIAFGVETIVSRLLGFPNPIAASLMADIVPVKNENSLKLADAISSSMVILDTGERPVVTNRGRVLRKYLQAVSDLREDAEVSIDEIEEYAREFELREFNSLSMLPSKIAEYVHTYEQLKAKGLKPEKVNEGVSGVFPPLESDEIPSPRISVSSRYSNFNI